MVNVIDKNSEITSQWIFREDGTVVINEFTDTATVIVDEGIWTLEQKATKALLNTAFGTVLSEQLGISVEWDIHYLKKNTMYLTHQDGGILTKEFERAK